MKKSIITLLFFAIASLGFSQQRVLDPTNMREGEKVEYCHTHTLHNQMMQNNPEYAAEYVKNQTKFNQELANYSGTQKMIYKIPVVFHVLHYGGAENISDEQIYDALAILNRDYRALNADTASVQAEFKPLIADVEFEFVLATKAPNGVCFKGITRTFSPLSFVASSQEGGSQVTAIKNGNDVYQGEWAGNKYLNIFICGDIGGAAGYTMKPWGNTAMSNGIWVLSDYVGSIGTSSVYTSRTLTHEVGHWFNLDHVWGGTNSPGLTTNCSSDDGVSDTPNCIGSNSCSLQANTCSGIDPYFGVDMKDPVENYMDYSYCSKMFTAGQKAFMVTAINSGTGGRNNLWKAANLTATGGGQMVLCKADFVASQTTVCVGTSVQFTDDTYNAATGWNWAFQGGTPATSTAQNPSVTYSTPGVYQVSLTSTDGVSSDNETKVSYIRVLPVSTGIPYYEGFEAYSSLTNSDWTVRNMNGNNAFELESTFGLSGSKCVKLVNYGQVGNNIDELESGSLDLSSLASTDIMTLSFRYAYRKKNTADDEWLRVFVSNNCGSTWTQRKTLHGSTLSSLTSSTSWAPAGASDWVTVHMTNVTPTFFVNNFRFKFEFDGANGNNIYLDDINLYKGSPSNTIVLGLEDQDLIQGVNLYPNPTEGDVHITFESLVAADAQIIVQEVNGKIAQEHTVKAATGSNLVLLDTQNLSNGMYFVKIRMNGSEKVMQFVVK